MSSTKKANEMPHNRVSIKMWAIFTNSFLSLVRMFLRVFSSHIRVWTAAGFIVLLPPHESAYFKEG